MTPRINPIRFIVSALSLIMMILSLSPAWAVDTDLDGIDDDKDFCIGDAEVAALGTAGEASLVHYYFGDGWPTSMGQEIGLDLSKAISGYDYSIALKQNETNDIDGAEEVYDPTQDNFFAALREIVRRGHVVDIYIFAHGISEGFSAYDNTADDDTNYIRAGEIENNLAPNKIGCAGHYLPIRMVYSITCFHSTLNATWTEVVGARASMGARDINFYPNQFGNFSDDWNDGRGFGNAVEDADTAASRTVSQIWIKADAAWNYPWYCIKKSPLGTNGCSRRYFPGEFPGMDFDSARSGQWNMNYTSEKLVVGDDGITRNDLDFDWRVPTDVTIQDIVMTDAWAELGADKKKSSKMDVAKITIPSTRVKAVFEVTVKNDSDYDIGAFVLTGPHEARVSEVTIPALGYQDSVVVAFTVVATKLADGTLAPDELTWTVDTEGTLNDTDTSNNTMTIAMLPDYEAELVLTTVEIDDEENPYRTVFSCTAKNNGNRSASESSTMEIYFAQDGDTDSTTMSSSTLIASYEIPALEPGEEYGEAGFYEHDIETQSAFHAYNAFICKVDTGDTIEETDETDNEDEVCLYCYDNEAPQDETPLSFDDTMVFSEVMINFGKEILALDDDIRAYIDNLDVITDNWIIIIIQYTQSENYLNLSADYLDGMLTAEEFETELQTQVKQTVAAYRSVLR